MHLRQLEAVIISGIRGEFRGRGRLEPEVELTQNHALEMRDHVGRSQASCARGKHLHHARREVEGVDIAAKRPFDPRPQNLHGHGLAALAQLRLVHLRDRGRRDRRAERREDILDRAAQLHGDFGLRDLDRERRQPVLKHAQLRRELLADEIGARREYLPELDIGRPECRQRAHRRRRGRVSVIAQPLERPGKRPHRAAQERGGIDRLHDETHGPGPLERRAGADQAQDIVRPPQIFQPECRQAIPIDRLR